MGQPQQEPWQWPPELEVRQISERSARLLLDACRRAYVADDGWYERHGLASEDT